MVCSVTPRINNGEATRERDGENEFREPLKSFESRATEVSLDLRDEGGEAQGSRRRAQRRGGTAGEHGPAPLPGVGRRKSVSDPSRWKRVAIAEHRGACAL